jgi:hypothetical protein
MCIYYLHKYRGNLRIEMRKITVFVFVFFPKKMRKIYLNAILAFFYLFDNIT